MNKKVLLTDSFESFEKILFGFQSYHQDSGFKDLVEWKERILKISNALKKSIEQNLIHTDKQHKKEVLFHINLLIEKIEKTNHFDNLMNDVIIKLSTIIFLILGDFPHNWNRKGKSFPKKWKLNKYRTLKYIITERKKTLLIFKHIEKIWHDNEKVQILREKLVLKMDSNYKKFNTWYKENHPEIYNDLFNY